MTPEELRALAAGRALPGDVAGWRDRIRQLEAEARRTGEVADLLVDLPPAAPPESTETILL